MEGGPAAFTDAAMESGAMGMTINTDLSMLMKQSFLYRAQMQVKLTQMLLESAVKSESMILFHPSASASRGSLPLQSSRPIL